MLRQIKSSNIALFQSSFQPFVADCFCVLQRKNEGFHLGELNNEVKESIFFCKIKIVK